MHLPPSEVFDPQRSSQKQGFAVLYELLAKATTAALDDIFSNKLCFTSSAKTKKINDTNKGYFGTCSCLFNSIFLKNKKAAGVGEGKGG